ncbi:MAG TPA: hypothetical protein VF407_08870, partial [Polyangiaceae bacterium]
MKRVALAVLASLAATSCGGGELTGAGPSDGGGSTLLPGEQCDPQNTAPVVVHFDPPSVVVAPGQSRPVRMIVDPDVCQTTTAQFTTDNAGVAAAPASATLDLRHTTYDFTVTGGSTGT